MKLVDKKMNFFHSGLEDKWNESTIFEQIANIGAEVGKALKWQNKNLELSNNALYRALELIDLTVKDPKNRPRLGEILRTRELLIDYLLGENIYKSDDIQWNKYFAFFNLTARNNT